jgi:predicted NBD/HSP70 family sugar kinase
MRARKGFTYGVTQEELRRHNLSTLLRYVHEHGPTSRAVLTASMNLNRSTIGALTADLASAGLVTEELPGQNLGAGRPSLVVVPRAAHVYALAYQIGVDFVVAARVGLGGQVLDRRELYRPRGDYDLEDVMGHLERFTRELLSSEDIPAGALCAGVGAAVPAAVRSVDGMLRFVPNMNWDDWGDAPLGDILHRRLIETFGIAAPVAVGNDADLGALAERTRGAAVGCDDVVYIIGEVGVGAGLISGGEAMSGHDGYAGEVGHMVVNPSGRLCRCGARGCWETEIGEPAILAAAGHADGNADGRRATVSELVAAAAAGDEKSVRALEHIGGWIALGVANIVTVFNPSMVIFGGLLGDVFPAVHRQIRANLLSGSLGVVREGVRLMTPGLGADSTLIGAAEKAFEPLLADPLGFVHTLSALGAVPEPSSRVP